jgi:hypothetical protein
MDEENEERMREYNLKIAYKNGIIDGIKRYAWWEDGKQYVGTHKKTLERAIQEIEKEYEGLEP